MLQHDVAYLALTDVRPMRHNSGVELNCLSANGEQQPTHRSTWLEQDFVTCPGDVDAIFATYQLTNTTSYCAHRCCPFDPNESQSVDVWLSALESETE